MVKRLARFALVLFPVLLALSCQAVDTMEMLEVDCETVSLLPGQSVAVSYAVEPDADVLVIVSTNQYIDYVHDPAHRTVTVTARGGDGVTVMEFRTQNITRRVTVYTHAVLER